MSVQLIEAAFLFSRKLQTADCRPHTDTEINERNLNTAMKKNYRIETKCVQGGYTPGNGEPRQIPIIQSTTFKYASGTEMGKLFDTVRSVFGF